jgi:hypothetical protein
MIWLQKTAESLRTTTCQMNGRLRDTSTMSRKANQKGAGLFNGSPSWRESQEPTQKLEESITNQEEE